LPRQLNIFDELIIDLFAGGGGASTGIELAIGRPVDIAINHDESAVAMHGINHPFTTHYCESVWEVDPREVAQGRPVGLLWLSPDCKHFSKAKGGAPVEKRIRGLAWVAVRYAATVRPRVIMLENVEEFKTWGPVKDGKPVKEKAGITFKSFINQLRALGYTVDWKELRACDYGAPTIRNRFFLIARRDGKPIVWPKPTHGKPDGETVRKGKLKPWRSASEIIDWSLPCPSIFDTSDEIWRKYGLRAVRPLAENTLKRIARGIKKFVIENPEPFIVRVNHSGAEHHYCNSVNDPLNTITAKNGWGVVTPIITCIGQTGFSEDRSRSVESPLNTTVTKQEACLIAPTLIQYHGEQSDRDVRGQSPGKPLLTADAANRYGLVTAFMSKYFDGGYQGSGNDPREPLNTVTGVDHNALVVANLTMFNGNAIGSELSEQINTVMAGATRFGMVTSHIVKLKGDNIGQPVEEPIQVITAGGNHFGEVRAFLIKYYGQGDGQTLTEGVHTVTGHDTFGLVTIRGERYAIVDIGLRMLTPRELFNAQGFPPDYVIDAGLGGAVIPKKDQVARCGNAVPPPFAEALVRANLPELCGKRIENMEELYREMAM
jgi:DNA (cytosine-5)-methyltransferase 1